MSEPASGAPGVVVDAALAGSRLDAAVVRLVPELSLRARRRLIGDGRVLVDGRPRGPAYKLLAGQTLSLAREVSDFPEGTSCPWPGPKLVATAGDFAAFFKPAGLDSETLAGRPGPSLAEAAAYCMPGRSPVLLTRLDRLTSGLAVAALTPAAAARFRELEDAGEVRKTYVCLAEGVMSGPAAATAALDTDGRSRTRVLGGYGPVIRDTQVFPLPFAAGPGRTLAAAVIAKGARHQIRAHLAHLSHPLAGDALYGGDARLGPVLLHCARVSWPGTVFESPPDWAQFQGVIKEVMTLLGTLPDCG